MRKIGSLIIAVAMLIAFTGVVMADQPVPAVFSKQSMVTTTTATVEGTLLDDSTMGMTITRNPTVIHHVQATGMGFPAPATILTLPAWNAFVAQVVANGGSVTWHLGNPAVGEAPGVIYIDSMNIPPGAMTVVIPAGSTFAGSTLGVVQLTVSLAPGFVQWDENVGMHTGMLQAGEIEATTTYDQSIVAQNGQSNYVRSSNLNTNNKLIGQSNFAPKTLLTFVVTGTAGSAMGDEKITLNTLGRATATATSMASPFGPATVGTSIPPYDNLVQAGGAFDITQGIVSTDANERFIASDAGVPNALNYKINLKGITTQTGAQPAYGSVSGWIDVDVKESRTATNQPSETMQYKSTASASGVVNGFTKTVGWLSGTNHV